MGGGALVLVASASKGADQGNMFEEVLESLCGLTVLSVGHASAAMMAL